MSVVSAPLKFHSESSFHCYFYFQFYSKLNPPSAALNVFFTSRLFFLYPFSYVDSLFMPDLISAILSATLAADLLSRSRNLSQFISQQNNFFVRLSLFFLFFFFYCRATATGDATLMLLTVYLLPDRKGKERKVFQTDTSA